MHAAIPGSVLVPIPAAGHMSNVENPAAFNEAVRDFLRRNRRTVLIQRSLVRTCRTTSTRPLSSPRRSHIDALLRRAVGERLGDHAPLTLPLEPVVADRRRRTQPFLGIPGLEQPPLRRVVSPDAGIAVGLQLLPDRQRVCLLVASPLPRGMRHAQRGR